MDRRTFAGCAAAAAITYQKTPVGIAFLGLSHSHGPEKLRVTRESADWRVAGVCERDPKIREEVSKLGVPLLSREELLERGDIEAVAVESDVRDHERDALAALGAGKHIHLEKPPAATMAGCRAVFDLAGTKRLLVQAGYMWRYHPGIHLAIEAARQGWLGAVYLVRGNISTLIDAASRPQWAEFSGGQMFEQGCHVLDPLVRLLGRPAKITSFLRSDGPYGDGMKDNTAAVLEWPRALGILHASTLQPGAFRHRSVEIYGANGSAVIRPIEPPALQIDLAKAAGPYAAGPTNVKLPAYRRYVDDFAELAAAIRGERKLRVTPEEDLLVHEALLKASGMA